MRDNVADAGTEPYMGAVLFWSPDIISRKVPAANPSVDFGPATWGDANLGENIEYGQDNYIYVRMHNRGNAPDNVTVSAYWTNASGFIHPGTWNLIETLNVDNVLPGEYRVAGPIIWPKADIPAVGHYCLIGVVNSVRDPIVIPGAFSTVSDYLDFVRNHNNICYRNITVIDALPDAPTPPYAFLLRGLPETSRHFRLEVRHRLPKGTKVEVKIGRKLRQLEHTKTMKIIPIVIQHDESMTIFQLNDYHPLIVENIFIKRNAAVPVELRIKLPRDVTEGEYLLHADQHMGDLHLGRVNYLVRIIKQKPERKYSRKK